MSDGEIDAHLHMAALFLVTDHEDKSLYDPIKIQSKINHWKDAGVNYFDFFLLSKQLASGFTIQSHLSEIEDKKPQTNQSNASKFMQKNSEQAKS